MRLPNTMIFEQKFPCYYPMVGVFPFRPQVIKSPSTCGLNRRRRVKNHYSRKVLFIEDMLSPTCERSAWGLLALNHLTGWYLGYKGRGGENTACIRIREGDALLPHTVQDVRRYIHSFIRARAL